MKKLFVCGGTAHFLRFLRLAFDGEVRIFPDMEFLGRRALEEAPDAVIVLPEDGSTVPALSFEGMRCYAKLRSRGQRGYFERYDAGDYNSREIFGLITDTAPRAVYDEVLDLNGKLLQLRCGSYLPARVSQEVRQEDILGRLTNAVGVHKPVIPGNASFPALIQREGFVSCTFGLSVYDRLTMLPRASWRALYARLFAPMLGVTERAVTDAFDAVWEPVRLSGAGTGPEEAARRAVRWHLESGIMPDTSGKSGCYEMIRSSDLSVRVNQRTDSMTLTAALLATAGAHFGDPELSAKGRALADYCLDEGLQYTEGPNRGIFKWFNDLDAGQCYTYSSDSARDGLAMLQLWRVTGEERYLRSAELLGDAFLRWTGGEAFLRRAFLNSCSDTLETLTRDEAPHNAPSFYCAFTVLLSSLWKITGKEAYREQVRRTAEAMAAADPDFTMNFTPLTYNLLYSRFLFILSAAQRIGCGDYSKRINGLLSFFDGLQDPSGGVADSAVIREKTTFTHPEFSVGMGKGYDRVVDNLYCTNNMLGSLSILCAPDMPGRVDLGLARHIREGLLRFACETQLAEPDTRLYGGWMRAFDLETGEYYGINKDKDWGPYCIMGGWVMGFVSLLLLEASGAPGIYRIGK